MECAAKQQARELAQLHRTVAMMAHMLEMNTALQEVQWQGMFVGAGKGENTGRTPPG